jgi:HEAT repeat protein
LLDDPDERVSTAAALALGEMRNDAGQELLRDALFDDDPEIRDRAARALGELGDKAAVPVLIEALGRDDLKVREHAIRLLGRLGDQRATEPLIETLAEDRTRYLSVLALGKLSDRRAIDPLLEVLEHETHTDIRGYTVVAFGWLKFPEVIPRVLRVLVEEPELRWTPEALVRLDAVGRSPLFGTDVAQGVQALAKGWGKCSARPWIEHHDYIGRTSCKTTGRSATLVFHAEAEAGALLILRARHLLVDKGQQAELAIEVDGVEVGRAQLGGDHAETRLETPGKVWGAGRHRVVLELDRPGKFEVDHLLVMAK